MTEEIVEPAVEAETPSTMDTPAPAHKLKEHRAPFKTVCGAPEPFFATSDYKFVTCEDCKPKDPTIE